MISLDRASADVIDGWVEMLGVDHWTDIPPLRTLLPILAIQRDAANLPDGDSVGDRWRAAAEYIGLDDDPYRSTHPADGFARTLRNWIADAGKFYQTLEDDAA